MVEDPEGRRHRRVAEVGVEGRELVGGAERLVGDRAEGERGDVEARRQLCAAARTVGAALELVGVDALGRADGELLDPGSTRTRTGAERRRVDRHLAPAQRLEPFVAAALLDRRARALVTDEDHGQPAAGLGQQRGRERQQDARPVPRLAVGRGGAAVADAAQAREQEVDDLTGRGPGRVRDEADATGTAVGGEIVE